MLKPWRRLLVLSYAGTLLLYVGWYSSFYDRSQLRLTVGFATLFFAIFAVAPLLARPAVRREGCPTRCRSFWRSPTPPDIFCKST